MSARQTARQALVLPVPAGVRLSTGARAFLVCYGGAVVLLFLSSPRQFEDESDNLLGAYLIVRGARLYADYFSSHMPFVYYLAAIPALFGAARLEEFRLFSNALLVAGTLAIVVGFRHRIAPPVLYTWATITVFAHTIQWGEMLHAGTIAGYGVVAAALLFYADPASTFRFRDKAALSLAIFVAVESSLLALYPLLLLAACYLAARVVAVRRGASARAQARQAASLLAIVLVPHLVVLAWLWAIGALGSFVYDAYLFNQLYYARYVMNPSAAGMVHDWEAQYRTYLRLNLARPLSADFFLIVANLGAAWVTLRTRGPAMALLYYAFIALTRVRPEGAYYMASYFSAALCLSHAGRTVLRWARSARGQPWRPPGALRVVPSLLFLGLAAVFAANLARSYDFAHAPYYRSPYVAVVDALTTPQERLFVAPYDPYLFLATGRLPATKYPFYFPWQAADPATEADLTAELQSSRPPVVVFLGDEPVNGQYLPREFGRGVLDFLKEAYAPLDPQDPVLRDLWVRADRVDAARQWLHPTGLL